MTTDLLIGRPIANCIVERKLGAGGMGAVYLATHQTLGKQIAVKVLPANPPPPEQFVERFFREARAMAQLEHPNIVGVSDVGSQEDFYYIVMQYVEGMPLERLVIDHGPLPIGRALAVVRDCAAAMAHAHSKGILHRDIKPDNIIIQKDGSIKMLDFGLAKLDGNESVALTLTGQIMGTPMYMAPEQAEGKPADHRTDIYSLGATGFYILTADYPFTGRSGMDILLKKVKEDPRDILSLRRDLPPAVGQLINKMMAREPDKRFQSMQRVVEILDRALAARAAAGQASAPAHAAPPGMHQPTHPTAARPAHSPHQPHQPSAPGQPANADAALPDPRALLSGQARPAAMQKQSLSAPAQAELPDPRALLTGNARRIQDAETRPLMPADNPATLLGVSGMQPTAVSATPAGGDIAIPSPMGESGPVLDVTLQVQSNDVVAEARAIGAQMSPAAAPARPPAVAARGRHAPLDDRPTIDLSQHRVQKRPARRGGARIAGQPDGADDGEAGSRVVLLVLVAVVILAALAVGGYALYVTYIAPAANNTRAGNNNGANGGLRIVDDNTNVNTSNANGNGNGTSNGVGDGNSTAGVTRPDDAVLNAFASGLPIDARKRRDGYHAEVDEHLLALRPFLAGGVLRRMIREFTGDPMIPYFDVQVRASLARNKSVAYASAFAQLRSLIDAGPLRWQDAADLARALEADAPDDIDRRLLSDVSFQAITRSITVRGTLIPFAGESFDRILSSRSASFIVTQTEVTVGEYAVFLYDTGRLSPADFGRLEGSPRTPATRISAEDARAYASWALGRLPTRTEFELLVRGRTPFEWDGQASSLVLRSNGATGPVEVDVPLTQLFATTPWGTPHIIGNVREWVDTPDGAEPLGASFADRRGDMEMLLSPPADFQGPRVGRSDTGFRIVCPLPAAEDYPRQREAALATLSAVLTRTIESPGKTLIDNVVTSLRCQAALENMGLATQALLRLTTPGTELLSAEIDDFALSSCGSAAYAVVSARIRFNRLPQRIVAKLVMTRTLRTDVEWVLDHLEAEHGRND